MRRIVPMVMLTALIALPMMVSAQQPGEAVAEADAEVAEAAAEGAEAVEEKGKLRIGELELTPEVLEKLDSDQVAALLEERERTKRQVIKIEPFFGGAEVLAPLGGFLMIILVVLIPIYFGFRKNRNLHETLRTMIEKGAEIPAELITPPPPKRNDLLRGLTFTGAGLGLSIFLALLEGTGKGVWACGLIPMFIGAGYLIAWWLQRKENGEQTAPRG